MKSIIKSILLFLICINVLGQSSQSFNYQAVLRNDAGEPITSQNVDLKIDILRGSDSGSEVFTETHNTATNEYGLINIQIGSESSLDGIDWSADEYFIRISVDGTVMGTSKLLSVPYAMYAKAADETDPIFESSPAFGIESTDIANWDEAHSWGDHAEEGYIDEESDPIFAASPAAGIDNADIDSWDEAYSWGDHDGLYLPHDWTPDWDDMPGGAEFGEMLFWNGTNWVPIDPGEYHHKLHLCDGVPTWGPCPPSVPVVITMAVSDIEEQDAKGGGNVVAQGSHSVTEYGLVWGTSEKPTVDIHDGIESITENIEGPFYFDLTDLTGETLYYVRAYAISGAGIAYGNQVEFTTLAASVFIATLTTDEVTDIEQTSAKSGGNVTNNGGSPVTARGIVWGTSSMPALGTSEGHLQDGDGGLGDFESDLTDLSPNTNYYVRAYAVNSVGIAYGNQRFFATLQDANRPTVSTESITDIEQTSATGGGDVTDSGDGEVLLRGVCWSTSENPTLDDSYIIDDLAEEGAFTSSITGLEPGTTYYVRAYASNSHGVAFGEQEEFETLAGPPVVEIVSRNAGNPGFRVIDVIVINDGGENVEQRGIVWDTEENPVLGVDNFTTEGGGIGEFSSTLTTEDLTVNTTYYIRAYATNSEGNGYSEQHVIHFWDYNDIVTYDGYQYNTVMIGDQEWMTENLKTTIYSNSLPITTGLTNDEWANTTEAAYSVYADNFDYKDTHGLLYNWYAVNSEHGICPDGWKVPSEEDFDELLDFVESIFNDGRAGNKLKSCRQVNSPLGGNCSVSDHPRWNADNTHYGTDEFGFSAHGVGFRKHNDGGYTLLNRQSLIWSSMDPDLMMYMFNDIGIAGTASLNRKQQGSPVRCIRDDD